MGRMYKLDMEKQITISIRPVEISLEDYDEEVNCNLGSKIDSEIFILSLKKTEVVEVLILRYLGYNYLEIKRIMNLKSIGKYYSLLNELKKDFEKMRSLGV